MMNFLPEPIKNAYKWAKEYLAPISPALESAGDTARDKAQAFSEELLLPEIAEVQEKASDSSRQNIQNRMSQPDFLRNIQVAMTSAALTDDRFSLEILAQIVSKRLLFDSDSLVAQASPIACEAIANINGQQLKSLGLLYHLENSKLPKPVALLSPEKARKREMQWVQRTFAPYKDLSLSRSDVMQLKAARCLSSRSGVWLSSDLADILRRATSPDFEYERFRETELGKHLQVLYDTTPGLRGTELTNAGSLLGFCVSELVVNRKPNVSKWEEQSRG